MKKRPVEGARRKAGLRAGSFSMFASSVVLRLSSKIKAKRPATVSGADRYTTIRAPGEGKDFGRRPCACKRQRIIRRRRTPPRPPPKRWRSLRAGNQRFVAGAPQTRGTRARAPYAVVLGCSDSRVPIETIFDQPPGRLFVVRVAGNFLNEDNLASIEFSVAVLKSKLVLVLRALELRRDRGRRRSRQRRHDPTGSHPGFGRQARPRRPQRAREPGRLGRQRRRRER